MSDISHDQLTKDCILWYTVANFGSYAMNYSFSRTPVNVGEALLPPMEKYRVFKEYLDGKSNPRAHIIPLIKKEASEDLESATRATRAGEVTEATKKIMRNVPQVLEATDEQFIEALEKSKDSLDIWIKLFERERFGQG